MASAGPPTRIDAPPTVLTPLADQPTELPLTYDSHSGSPSGFFAAPDRWVALRSDNELARVAALQMRAVWASQIYGQNTATGS